MVLEKVDFNMHSTEAIHSVSQLNSRPLSQLADTAIGAGVDADDFLSSFSFPLNRT
jgi:hypothetical protein